MCCVQPDFLLYFNIINGRLEASGIESVPVYLNTSSTVLGLYLLFDSSEVLVH